MKPAGGHPSSARPNVSQDGRQDALISLKEGLIPAAFVGQNRLLNQPRASGERPFKRVQHIQLFLMCIENFYLIQALRLATAG